MVERARILHNLAPKVEAEAARVRVLHKVAIGNYGRGRNLDPRLWGVALKRWRPTIDIRVYRKGIGNQAPPQEMRFACTVIILIAHNWVTYSGHGVQV